MSIISKIGNWLAGIFSKTRPGLAQFIHEHEAQAVTILETTALGFVGKPMNEWRNVAFADMSSAINSAKQHPDTWISILVDLAHDVIKAQGA